MSTSSDQVRERQKRVLFVHQGAELYGSDRTFEQSVRAYRLAQPESYITVLLAADGPLVELLQTHADRLVIEPLFVLRKQLLKSGALFNLPLLLKAVRTARSRVSGYDAVYINTAVIIDYIFACRLENVPAVLHVHELPTGISQYLLRVVVACSAATIIFNSQATRRAFGAQEDNYHHVVPNGTIVRSQVPLEIDDTLRILLLGRFNSWKGQTLLVSALALLEPHFIKRIRVIMAGGVFQDQHHYKDEVTTLVSEKRLQGCIEFKEFMKDPAELYQWSTVVAVPSLLPEPFGLVAIEAMGHGRPVIAADHGGLADIVINEITGIRFVPGDPESLAAALRTYLEHPELMVTHGASGKERYQDLYHEDRFMEAVSSIIHRTLRA